MPDRLSRTKRVTSWREAAKIVAAASGIGAAFQVVIVLTTTGHNPVPVGTFVGGVQAVSTLMALDVGMRRILVAATVAGISAGLLWIPFNALGVAPWSTVAFAAVCPSICVAAGRVLAGRSNSTT